MRAREKKEQQNNTEPQKKTKPLELVPFSVLCIETANSGNSQTLFIVGCSKLKIPIDCSSACFCVRFIPRFIYEFIISCTETAIHELNLSLTYTHTHTLSWWRAYMHHARTNDKVLCDICMCTRKFAEISSSSYYDFHIIIGK